MKIMYFNCKAGSNHAGDYIVPNYIFETICSEIDRPHIVILTEVIPLFEDSDKYRKFCSDYSIYSSGFVQGKKNSVIIAVKNVKKDKDIDIEVTSVNDVIRSDKGVSAPDYLNIQIIKNSKTYNIIGFRMIAHKNYDVRRKIFDSFLKNNKLVVEGAITILAGDFNNAMHYGDINQSFDEVKSEYWKNGKKVAQYNYNLHIIKDILSEKGFKLIEKEEDYSFGDKIHDDHFFISSEKEKSVDISFHDSKQPLDHRYFVAVIEED